MPLLDTELNDLDQAQDWKPICVPQLIGVLLAAVFLLYLTHSGERWVPLLDNANLAFHEFGHPFFGIFSDRLMVYGGTLGQLIFPITTIVVFWKRREALSFALCWLWLFDNVFNIARYMADARALELPLVGGGGEDRHDWFNIFSNWGVLNSDTTIATFVGYIAIIGTISVCTWFFFRCLRREN